MSERITGGPLDGLWVLPLEIHRLIDQLQDENGALRALLTDAPCTCPRRLDDREHFSWCFRLKAEKALGGDAG